MPQGSPVFFATHRSVCIGLLRTTGFDRASAESALQAGQADLIAFARPFLANPDLVQRMRADAALNAVDMATLYTPGQKSYTDYPILAG